MRVISKTHQQIAVSIIFRFEHRKVIGQDKNKSKQLARQAQKLQDDMEAASKELEAKEYEAAAGGGAVKVTVTGKMELTKVEISPEVVDPEDVEMLADLVMAAANEAIRAAAKEKESKMETISGGLNIPGMF